MKKFPFIFLSTEEQRADIYKAVKKGELRKIGPKLYSSNTKDEPAQIVRQNIWQIISLLLPGAVVSNRSAVENKISPDNRIYLTGAYTRAIRLPGIELVVIKGHGPIAEWDNPLFDFFIACRERAYIENLTKTKAKGSELKNLSQYELEERLILIYKNGGADELNKLRNRSKQISVLLGLENEGKILDNLIGGIQGTQEAELMSPLGKAYSIGAGYDPIVVERFSILRSALADDSFPDRMVDHDGSLLSFYNVSFFDAYFSNFIEGTEFEVEEAIEIVDSGVVPADRPEDGHDILGTYRIVGSAYEMNIIPGSFDDFLEILTRRHATIMEGRPDKGPGRFKDRPNRAGTKQFVDPALVKNTLRHGYELYRGLEHPFARALAIMFIISEVHPFIDGNGRISRAMMNAELVSKGMTRIIIPSAYRGDYLSGLRSLSDVNDPVAFITQMKHAQNFVSKVDFSHRDSAISILRGCNAFEKPDSDKMLKMPL